MAMTPSQLSIIVQSKGIKDATDDLNNLAKAASSVDKETKAFVIAQQKLSESNSKVSKSSEATARGVSAQELALIRAHNAANKMNDAMTATAVKQKLMADNKLAAELERQAVASERAAKAAEAHERGMVKQHMQALKMNEAFDKHAKGLDEVTRRGNVYVNTLRSMATAALAYVGVNFFANIIKQADAWGLLQAKLKLAVGSMELAKSVQNDLFNMSQNLRVPLEDTAKLFTRMSVPLQRMGQTVGDTKKVVEAFSMALKLGGATGQEASSAMLQLSQSFNAGRLNGGEFNSVAEAAPSVLRAIEVELKRVGKGADLAKYGLKELAAKGIISVEIMAEALKRAAPKWEEEFKQLPLTVDGAMTRIKNAWQRAIGEMGQDTKFNERLAKSLKTIEDMLPSVAKAIAGAFVFMVDNGEILLKTLAGILAVGAAFKAWAVVSAMYAAGTAAMALSGGLAAVRAALLVIGITPVGLAITALGAILAGSITLLGKKKQAWESVKEASDKVKSNDELIKSMKLETLAMMEQVDVARNKASLPPLYTKEIESAKKATGATSAYTEALNTAAKVEKDILTWKKSQKGGISLEVGKGEYYLPKDLVKAREDAKRAVEQEKVKNAEVAEQTRLGAQIKEAANKESMNKLAEQYALEAKTGKQRAEAVKAAAIAELDVLVKNGLSKQAAFDRMIKIERDYQEALDKIKSPKAEKEANKNLEDYNKRLDEIIKSTAIINQEMANMKTFGDAWEKMLPEEKKLMDVISNFDKVSSAVGKVRAQAELDAAMKKANAALEAKFLQDELAGKLKVIDSAEKSAKSAQEELKSVEDQIAAFGKVKGSIQESEMARLNDQLTVAKGIVGQEALVKALEEEIKTRDKIKEKTGELAGLKDVSKLDTDAKKALADMWDTSKVDKFESATSKALKGALKGFVDLIKVMDKYKAAQSYIADRTKDNERTNRKTAEGELEYQKNKAEIARKSDEYQIAAYASMATAARDFFKEGTKGYQAMDAVSKVYHAAQMARNLMEMTMLATKGVMNQAGGDVYTAIPRMAAMAAIMAGLGYATGMFGSSGSGGMKAADVQKTQGSGTVFGDAEAKSESISKTIELLKKSTDRLYPVNQGMLKSLQSIESNMTGLANLVIRSGGIAEGSNMGIKESKTASTFGSGMFSFANSLTGGLFASAIDPLGKAIQKLWGGTEKKIIDSGLQFGGSLSGMKQGQGFNQYASVDTTTSKYFGLSKETNNEIKKQSLDKAVTDQLALVFTNMQKTLEEAGKALYGSSTFVTDALKNMVVEVTNLSLKGLSGEEATQAINNVISKTLDQMAATAFKSLDSLQSLVGEGYAEKVIRIANSFATANAILGKFNFKLFEMSDAGIKASMAFTELFGSLENLQSVTSSYFENFYREEEQVKIKTEAVAKIMKSLGKEMPATREGFKLLVDQAQAAGNLELVANLMKVSGAFAEVVQWAEKAADSTMNYVGEAANRPSLEDDVLPSLKEALTKSAEVAQKWLSVSKQASDIRAQIGNVLGGNDNIKMEATRRAEKLWKMMSSDITVEQKLSLAAELKDNIIFTYIRSIRIIFWLRWITGCGCGWVNDLHPAQFRWHYRSGLADKRIRNLILGYRNLKLNNCRKRSNNFYKLCFVIGNEWSKYWACNNCNWRFGNGWRRSKVGYLGDLI